MRCADASSVPRRPLLVELVGPPGVGKSTISEALLRRDDRIQARPLPRRRAYAGVLGWNLLAVVTMALRHRMLRRFGGEGLRALTYLRALPRILEANSSDGVVVFDQGPIFLLTRPPTLDERLTGWHTRALATWDALLDVIVVLDAPDAVLIDRINTRSKEHRVKGSYAGTAAAFLAQSRAVYDAAIGGLGQHASNATILRFDTSRHSPAEVVEEIFATVAQLRPGLDLRSAPSPS